MTRKRPSKPSLSMQLEALFKRFPILCVVCSERLEWDEDREWHHLIEHADGGEHCAENLGPAHPKPCHKKVSRNAEARRHHIERLETARTQAQTQNPVPPISETPKLQSLCRFKIGNEMSAIEISPVERLALKKLALVVGALADTFSDHHAKRETRALLSVLMDVISRSDKP